jgi:hypothetical protein
LATAPQPAIRTKVLVNLDEARAFVVTVGYILAQGANWLAAAPRGWMALLFEDGLEFPRGDPAGIMLGEEGAEFLGTHSTQRRVGHVPIQ